MWPFILFWTPPTPTMCGEWELKGRFSTEIVMLKKWINTCPAVGHQWKNNIQPPNPNHHLSTPFKTWVVFSMKNQPLLHNPPAPNATTLRTKTTWFVRAPLSVTPGFYQLHLSSQPPRTAQTFAANTAFRSRRNFEAIYLYAVILWSSSQYLQRFLQNS